MSASARGARCWAGSLAAAAPPAAPERGRRGLRALAAAIALAAVLPYYNLD